MSLRKRLRVVFVCACLELGALAGVPMRPEQIRALMQQLNEPTLAHVLPSAHDAGDDPPDEAPQVPAERQAATRSTS